MCVCLCVCVYVKLTRTLDMYIQLLFVKVSSLSSPPHSWPASSMQDSLDQGGYMYIYIYICMCVFVFVFEYVCMGECITNLSRVL